MDGEVIDALLTLLNEGVFIHLPGEVLHTAIDLLKRLIDRHGAYGHRAVAHDPLAGLMDILSC